MIQTRRPPEVDRAAASRRAVAARRESAALKKDVAMRVITAEAAASRPGAPRSPAGAMRVTEFLTALPAIGEGKRDRILAELGIAPVKRLGGLGPRQRVALAHWLDERFPFRPRAGRSRLVVLAGPTAVGKGTVAAHIKEHHPEILLSVSATTRAPRPGEVDGEHYFFVDDAEFDRLVATASCSNTPRCTTRTATARRRPHREGSPRAVPSSSRSTCRAPVRCAPPRPTRLVFLLPPSWDELVQRLVGRGTEDEEERARRLRTAKTELASQGEFDYVVVNDDVARAAAEVAALAR
jgi:guanylate kinase